MGAIMLKPGEPAVEDGDIIWVLNDVYHPSSMDPSPPAHTTAIRGALANLHPRRRAAATGWNS